MLKFLLLFFLLHPILSWAQFDSDSDDMEQFNIGGDIFSDFNEDLETTRIMEDERFYKYSRFFSFELSAGITTFDGNRGAAYENQPPTFGLGLHYFQNFNTSFGIGFTTSKHHFFIDQPVAGFPEPLGFVNVNMLEFWFGLRHYLDTTNLGTAITYSNPYLVGRMEYWYTSNKYLDQPNETPDNGGGFGFAGGFGMEFPIVLKEYYLGTEFLYHFVSYADKFTQRYRPLQEGGYGYEDLTGNTFTMMISFTQSW